MTLLSAPHISGNEWQYVKDCLDTGWVSSVGAYVTKFESMVAEFSQNKFGIAAVNGTAALHIALQLNGVKRGDYVIVPNITFIASCNSIKYTGANLILMDIDADTWQMDLYLLEKFLQEETTFNKKGQTVLKKNNRVVKALMPVHVLGNICDMEHCMAIAKKYNMAVVEDATEALGSYYKGKHAGSFGAISAFSFNGNKIITTGGGGMIVTNDEALAKKAKHITTQAKSDPLEYIHDEVGYNYRLVNVLAAIGVAQMEQLPSFITRRQQINAYYRASLSDIIDIQFQKITEGVDANCWLFTFKIPNMRTVLTELNKKGIQARPFWVPMNQLKMFKKEIYYTQNDISNQTYQNCISIPSSSFLTDEDLELVVKTIKSVVYE
jgi:perosamine synthetase